MYRKVWTIPDRVFDILDDFPEEVEIEVIRIIRAYHRWFDEMGSDEGFNVSVASPQAQSVFWRVYDELHDADMRYVEKCAILSENGKKGVEGKRKKQARKEAKKKWYQENKEKVSRQRNNHRDKNGNRLPFEGEEKELKPVDNNLQALSDGLSNNGTQSQADSHLQRTQANACENNKKVSDNLQALSNTVSNNTTQSQADSHLQRTQANAYRQYSLNNIPTLRSGILLERGIGGKPSYPQEEEKPPLEWVQDKNNNRTGNLSCSKAEQPPSSSPVAAVKAVGQRGSRQFEQFGIKDRWQSGKAAVGTPAVSAPPDKPSAGSARKDGASGYVPLPSAPHEPREGEVLITKKFEVDFDDPIFQPYFRADRFLRRALNDWIRKNKIGCSVEKRWIAKQLVKFAQRQGKLKVLMGVEDDEQ